MTNPYYELGRRAAVAASCANSGSTCEAIIEKKAAIDEVLSDPISQKQILKIAHTIFTEAGPEYSSDAAACAYMAEFPIIKSAHARKVYLESTLKVLCDAAEQEKKASMEKLAKIPGLGMFTTMVGGSPQALQTLAALGVLAGAGIGTATWGISRGMKHTTDSIAEKETMVKYYKDLAKKLKGKMENEEDIPAEVKDEIKNTYA